MDGVRKKHESIEAFLGKRVHEALEWLYGFENIEKSFITFDRLCQIYDNQRAIKWHPNIYIADSRKKSSFYYSIGKRCLSNYYSRYGPTFDQRVEGTEVELKFSIEDYNFRGIIDRLDHPEPGKWIVHDYKTSKHPKIPSPPHSTRNSVESTTACSACVWRNPMCCSCFFQMTTCRISTTKILN